MKSKTDMGKVKSLGGEISNRLRNILLLVPLGFCALLTE